MRFLIRNQYLLLTLAVFILAGVLIQRQIAMAQAAHVERREDFLVLRERGQTKPAEHVYQLLIQDLPQMNLRSLADDLQRTALLTDSTNVHREDLLWKYHVSVRNEMNRRAERRLAQTLRSGEEP